MKILLSIFPVVFSYSLSASSVEIDSNMRLDEIQKEQMVDTDVRIFLVEPEKVIQRESDEWIRGPISGGDHAIGSNYDSIHNINPKVGAFISICFLSFVVYIIFRVRRSLKKEKRN